MLLIKVKKNYFQDVLRLMQIANEIRQLPGVHKAAAAMATEKAKGALRDAKLMTEETEAAQGSDLIMAVEADSEERARQALARMEELIVGAGAETSQGAADLLTQKVRVINVGLESFRQALEAQGVEVAHVNWHPPAGGDPELVRLLKKVF
jgi:hypothetical protein